MPNINDMKESKFLKQQDCDPAILVTIQKLYQDNVAKKNDPPELKWVIKFAEQEKPLVLNATNAQIIAQFLGSEDTDDWIGHKIVLYRDPSISYGGKVVGGVRARAPKYQQPVGGKFANQGGKKPQPARRPAPPPPQDEGPPEYEAGGYEENPDADSPY
jgi:hypothetical protein